MLTIVKLRSYIEVTILLHGRVNCYAMNEDKCKR